MDPDRVLGYKLPQVQYVYTERDVALYALAVGAASEDPTDQTELHFVYEGDGTNQLKTLPSFGVLFMPDFTKVLQQVPGMQFDPALLLHGEQQLELLQPLPAQATIVSESQIVGLHDKGKGALVEAEVVSRNAATGAVLCINRVSMFLRGAGGWGKTSSADSTSSASASKSKSQEQPKGPPTHNYSQATRQEQALLYRLLGDYNPLHADPELAASAGFPRPILHGLCTLGYAVRAVIRCCCDGDASRVSHIQGRFLKHVFPGETLSTDIWYNPKDGRAHLVTTVRERQAAVFSGTVKVLDRVARL